MNRAGSHVSLTACSNSLARLGSDFRTESAQPYRAARSRSSIDGVAVVVWSCAYWFLFRFLLRRLLLVGTHYLSENSDAPGALHAAHLADSVWNPRAGRFCDQTAAQVDGYVVCTVVARTVVPGNQVTGLKVL